MVTLAIALSGCSHLFPQKAGPTLQHFAYEAPAIGTEAPNISVTTLDGSSIELHSLFGTRPVVLQLGSYTCPVFRYRRFDMQPLRQRYQDQIEFVVLYTVEAHPVGSNSPYVDREWDPWHNRLTRVRIKQADSLLQRQSQASFARQQMHSNARFLVDAMNDSGWQAYGRAPSAVFVIDSEGIIQFRQVWVEPRALEEQIKATLNEAGKSAIKEGTLHDIQ